MKIVIMSVTHKKYWMPQDDLYLPVQVGFQESLRIQRDNEGENISEKNKNYCELTALYWGWKNLNADVVGLDHYRRHFCRRRFGDKKERVLLKKDVEALMETTDVLLPSKRHYWIETNQSQYEHAHHAEDLVVLRQVLSEKYPDYIPFYDAEMKKTSGHRFNMMVMKRDLYDAYCAFLFDVLFEVERRLDISNYSEYDARVFGFLSERLLDVWVFANHVAYREIPYVFMENQNWLKKGFNFLRRKFGGDKNA